MLVSLPLGTVRSRLRATVAAFGILSLATACSDNDTITEPVGDPAECTTTTTAANDGAWVQLCKVSGPVRHIRIENAKAGRTHASAQVVIGSAAAPTATSGVLNADQFRVLLYGGGTPAPTPQLQATFGTADATLDENATYINSGATVCFDIHDGSASAAPQFVIWVSGQKGADCASRTTLTLATAVGVRSGWTGATGAVSKSLNSWFRQAAGGGTTPKIFVSTTPVLEAAAITASASCNSVPTATTDWQQLCAPTGGLARHFRIETVQSTASNSYFYAVIGQDAAPTGNPAASTGKLIVTGGRSNSGTSWTWFRFGSGSTTQFSYATDAAAGLYIAGPNTICFDVGSNSAGNARIVFWATGAKGADCAVKSTLTLARALYDSSTDTATGSMFDAPLATGKLNFVKTNSTSATLGRVTVSSESAAL